MSAQRVLLLGLGDLGSQVLDVLVRLPGTYHFLIGGRNVEQLRQRSNVSVFAAMQLGYFPDVSCAHIDVFDIHQTADTITRFRPDIIFCAATFRPWMMMKTLPPTIFERLYQAMAGPWLSWPLVVVHKLMQAVHQTGLNIKVINASYPDAVNTVLKRVGLAPTIGIGNLANNIPALTRSMALQLDVPVEQIQLFFVAQHYASNKISRVGNTGGAPFHLTVLVNGKDLTHLLDREHVFDLLPTVFHRAAKGAGQLITAASAAVVLRGLTNETRIFTHAPGPLGLPGGYPVCISSQGVEVTLPPSLSLEDAIQINETGLRFDGIEQIGHDGTVYFTEKNMAILKDILQYDCQRMPLDEVEYWAKELLVKYEAVARQYRLH